MSQKNPLHIGIAGLGTVGVGVIKILEGQAERLKLQTGRDIQIVAISAQSQKDRGHDLSPYRWYDNPIDMASDDNIDCLVELIGGDSGVAFDLVQSALNHGKHVVTANKALISKHGNDLAKIAEEHGVTLNYEAAVAGGIPIIKTMRESLAGNTVQKMTAILNGTSNYILSQMRMHHMPFGQALKDAQDKGYAEADPAFDINGTDAAHKLSILNAIAYGMPIEFNSIHLAGMEHVEPFDIRMAAELDCRVKIIAQSRMIDGKLSQSVTPCLVPDTHPLYDVEGVTNAIHICGDAVGDCVLIGAGAGREATASSVVSDLVDIARGHIIYTFGIPHDHVKSKSTLHYQDIEAQFYVRVDVKDQVGVVAALSDVLSDHKISIKTMIQRTRKSKDSVPVVFMTHKTQYFEVKAAAEEMSAMDISVSAPIILEMLDPNETE